MKQKVRPSVGKDGLFCSPRLPMGNLEVALGRVREAVVSTDAHGRIQWSNGVFQQLVGGTADGLRGASLAELLPLEKDARPVPLRQHPVRRALHTKDPGNDVYEFRKPERTANVELFWTPCQEGSEEGGVLLTILDVTEAKWGGERERELLAIARRRAADLEKAYNKLQEIQTELIQAEKLSALGRFASGVAHEVKNPLAIILSGLEFIGQKTSQTNPDLQREVDLIKSAAKRADEVVKNLLRFAQPSLMTKENVRPEEIVQESASLIWHEGSPRNVSIKILPHRNRDLWVHVCKNQILQVFVNVLKNAVEAMAQGGTVRVQIGKEANLCVIAIADSGEGIRKEDLERVFEPFFTTKRESKGTGLGLSVSKTIVENHGGRLTLESQQGRGTVARVFLPLVA